MFSTPVAGAPSSAARGNRTVRSRRAAAESGGAPGTALGTLAAAGVAAEPDRPGAVVSIRSSTRPSVATTVPGRYACSLSDTHTVSPTTTSSGFTSPGSTAGRGMNPSSDGAVAGAAAAGSGDASIPLPPRVGTGRAGVAAPPAAGATTSGAGDGVGDTAPPAAVRTVLGSATGAGAGEGACGIDGSTGAGEGA